MKNYLKLIWKIITSTSSSKEQIRLNDKFAKDYVKYFWK